MTEQWRGRFLEDFAVGDVYRSRLGRTITETDNIWFTCLTMNTNQMHFNREYAERDRVRAAARRLDADARDRARPVGRGHARERGREPRLGRHQAAEPGLRRRHALGRERGARACASRARGPRAGSSRSAPAGSTSAARS